MWWSAWPGDHSLDKIENRFGLFLDILFSLKNVYIKLKNTRIFIPFFRVNKKDKKVIKIPYLIRLKK